jgi:hypothetical protein
VFTVQCEFVLGIYLRLILIRPAFDPRTVYVGFVVEKVALGQFYFG